MYLQAMAAQYQRAGYRRYFFVVADSAEQRAHYQGMRSALAARGFGAQEAGHAVTPPFSPTYADSFSQIHKAQPDVVILMLDATAQRDFLQQYQSSEARGIPVTGYPSAVAQTRGFYYAALKSSAPVGGARAALWDATLDADGADQLNARYLARWGWPMVGYESVKMLYETALSAGSFDGEGLLAQLENPQASFDVHKGVEVSFRPWNHQLHQPLYMATINPDAQRPEELASLVGQVPAMDTRGTGFVERLDQIGVSQGRSQCNFG